MNDSEKRVSNATDRERLIEEMAREVAALNGHSDDWDRFLCEARDYLADAERALAEKHARIVEDMLSDYCDVTRRVIAAAIRASVEKKDG